MKSRGWGPQNGISALIRGGGDKGSTCTTEDHVSTKQEEVPPPEPNHAGTPILDVHPPDCEN